MVKETARSAEMRQMLVEYSTSGIPRRQFCEKRGIALTTFDHWRRELRLKPPIVKVEVVEPVEEAVERSHFVLTLCNGRQIESSWGFDEAQLGQLIRVVEGA